MAKYIDTELLIKALKQSSELTSRYADAVRVFEVCIKLMKPADVVEVKHGKWYRHDKKTHGDTCYHCSVCEKMALTDCGMVWELTPYCPFCGAKMDGGKENEQT